MLNERLPADALLAVYPDRAAADAAVRRVVEARTDPAVIFVDAVEDVVRSLDGEVREEVTQSVGHGSVGVAYPKEVTRATVRWLPVVVAVGAVLGALVALPFELSDWGLWVRLLIGAFAGATMFLAIAMVVIPAMSVRNPQAPSPASTGSTVRVEDVRDEVVRALLPGGLQRLDRLRDGVVIDTLATEDDLSGESPTDELIASFVREAKARPEDRTR